MKCPNCGFEIPEGKMYCESCGAELQIVPDYEIDADSSIDIESEMKQTMNNIAISEFAKEYDIDFDDDPNIFSMLFRSHKSGKAFYFLLAIVLIGIVVASVFLGSKISKQNSYEYQIQLADEKMAAGEVLNAIGALEAAYKIKPDADLLFTIADYYYTLGRDNDAIYTLQDIATGDFAAIDIENAYKKIITLYNSSQSYELIANLLENCKSESIINQYSDYLVYTPEFNVPEGTYEETITVKLSADGPGTIYYTMDASEPDSKSTKFDTPIFLEYGSYTISAVYINAFGVKSEVVKAKYLIDVDFVFEPTILTDSGTYTEATLIEADVPLLYTLYYTVDGTDPTKESTRYTGPIPMKPGESTYKFICYATDGTESSIIERNYNLELIATYEPAQAVEGLVAYLISIGNVYDDGCHREGVNGTLLFMYSAIYPFSEVGNCYMVVEYLQDDFGNRATTGNVYAVGCNDLTVYKVNTAGSEYTLTSVY